MRTGFTDIHHHLLYGLDDGPKSKNGMYRMLCKAAEEGITEIVATPAGSGGGDDLHTSGPRPGPRQRLLGAPARHRRTLAGDGGRSQEAEPVI